jgi:hypothetical protein
MALLYTRLQERRSTGLLQAIAVAVCRWMQREMATEVIRSACSEYGRIWKLERVLVDGSA